MFACKINFYFSRLLANATEIYLNPIAGHGLFQRVTVFLFGDQLIYSGIACECNGAVLVIGCDVFLGRRKTWKYEQAKKKSRF